MFGDPSAWVSSSIFPRTERPSGTVFVEISLCARFYTGLASQQGIRVIATDVVATYVVCSLIVSLCDTLDAAQIPPDCQIPAFN